MRAILIPGLLLLTSYLHAQNPFPGLYTGIVNGDPVELQLTATDQDNLKGTLKDSYQRFDLQLKKTSANIFSGRAIESSLHLDLPAKGELSGDQLTLTLDLSALASGQQIVAKLRKQAVGAAPKKTSPPEPGLRRDPALVGTWSKTDMYQSGSGSDYFSGSTETLLSFLPDGRLQEGGSQVVVGGADYTGLSSGAGGNMAEGMSWYTENSYLYLKVSADGKTQMLRLGRYYIENGNMLITTDKGEKQLFKRKR